MTYYFSNIHTKNLQIISYQEQAEGEALGSPATDSLEHGAKSYSERLADKKLFYQKPLLT